MDKTNQPMIETINLFDRVMIVRDMSFIVSAKPDDALVTTNLQGKVGRVVHIFNSPDGKLYHLVFFEEDGFGWIFERDDIYLRERAVNETATTQEPTTQEARVSTQVTDHEAIRMLSNAVERRLAKEQDMVDFMQDHKFPHEMSYHQTRCDMLLSFLSMIRDVTRTVKDENRCRAQRGTAEKVMTIQPEKHNDYAKK